MPQTSPPTLLQMYSPSACWALLGAAAHREAARFGLSDGTPLQREAEAGVAVQVQLMMENYPKDVL